MTKYVSSILFFSVLSQSLIAAEPTELRDWESAKGQKIRAKAMTFEDGVVMLRRSSGKEGKVPLSALSEEDQDFIKKHFAKEEAPEVDETPVAEKEPTKAKRKKGKKGGLAVEGPQKSSEESSYSYHIPSTAPGDGTGPALFWHGGGRPGNASDIKRFEKSAELTGAVIIACGSSSNSGKRNSDSIEENLEHSIAHCSVSEDRIFFAGPSGGGARTMGSASRFKTAGAMPIVGYLSDGLRPSKSAYYYVLIGAYDFNRYASGGMVKELGSKAIGRIATYGHGTHGENVQALNDGLIWLYTRNAYNGKGADTSELEKFEERFYTYLTTDLESQQHLAYYWAHHMVNTCKMKGSNAVKFSELFSTLGKDPINVAYLNGREALEKVVEKELAEFGPHPGSKFKHTSSSVNKAAAKILKKFEGIPEIPEVAKDLGKKTDSLKKK